MGDGNLASIRLTRKYAHVNHTFAHLEYYVYFGTCLIPYNSITVKKIGKEPHRYMGDVNLASIRLTRKYAPVNHTFAHLEYDIYFI